jgi:hypothetical protein
MRLGITEGIEDMQASRYLRLQDAVRVANQDKERKEYAKIFYLPDDPDNKVYYRTSHPGEINRLSMKGYKLLAEFNESSGRVERIVNGNGYVEPTETPQPSPEPPTAESPAPSSQEGIEPPADPRFAAVFRDPTRSYGWLLARIPDEDLLSSKDESIRQHVVSAAREIYEYKKEELGDSMPSFTDFLKVSDFNAAYSYALKLRENLRAKIYLEAVTTPREVSLQFNVSEDGVRKAIKRGNGELVYRRSGSTILLLKEQVARLWDKR